MPEYTVRVKILCRDVEHCGDLSGTICNEFKRSYIDYEPHFCCLFKQDLEQDVSWIKRCKQCREGQI